MLVTNITSNELAHIFLNPFDAKVHGYFKMKLEKHDVVHYDDYISTSSTILFLHQDNVLASTMKMKQTIINIFYSYDISIYISLFLFIIIMSLITGLSRNSMKSFLSISWSYLSVLLTDYCTLRAQSLVDRCLIGGWLLSSTILLAVFSGLMRDVLTKPKSIHWIDSWNDLSDWKHLKVVTPTTSSLAYNIKTFGKDPMAEGFADRVSIGIDFDKYEKGEMSYDNDIDYLSIKEGKLALIADLDVLTILKKNLVTKYRLKEDIDFHVSESEDTVHQPAFLTLNKLKMNKTMTDKLNLA